MSANNNTQIERMRELVALLTKADIAYYRDDEPIMLDREYDKFTDELKALEAATGIILAGSPTQKVSGEILDSLTPVTHSKPMLSADKTKLVSDVQKFARGHSVMMSWKLDGLTLVLRYDNGEFKQAVTRGREGIVGEDVTHTVKTFRNVPLRIPYQGYLELRGEGVTSFENFENINMGLEDPYSLPRSFAAGSVRKLDSNEARKRGIQFYAFELVNEPFATNSKKEQQEFLKSQGFDIVEYIILGVDHSDEEVETAINSFVPENYSNPTDGIIIEQDDIAYGRSLGGTGHHDNRMLAFKWEDDLYETKFLGVELATTRTGMVSITGLFESVEIDGAKVNHAYLHNLDIFDEFQFGAGDTIKVYKANMIIPQIASNETQSNTFKLDMTCPCCGQPLVVKTSSGGTRQLYCENPHCTAKLVRRFVHFCHKTRMNIEGLSEKTLGKFIGHGWIRDFGDLYDLAQHREAIINTDGFREKSYNRLIQSIEKSRHCTLGKFIAALGIPNVGRHAGRDLERYFHGSWEAFHDAVRNGFDFSQLPDFGETMNKNIHDWYADLAETQLWFPLLDCVIFEKEKEITTMANTNNPFYGKTVVATGKLNNYTRDGIQNKLISLGANPASSVTKNTDYLIVGEKAGSKLAKAQQLGVKTLTEEEFEAMIAS